MPPEASPVDFDAIVSAFTRGDRADARAMAAAALENGLDEPLVLYLVAEEAEEQGRDSEAIDLLRRATDIAPEEPDLWHRMGGVLVRQGQWLAGARGVSDSAEASSGFCRSDDRSRERKLPAGRIERCRGYFRHAAELAPGAAEPLAALAAIAAQRNRPQDARSLAERALALESRYRDGRAGHRTRRSY